MARLSLAQVARGTDGVLLRGEAESVVESFSIDTRTLKPGDLFFALVGPHHDAHRFVPEAIKKGARAVVISRGRAGDFPGEAALMRVADTTKALQELAAWVRHQQEVKVVGITGSSGKTTTKEMTAAILEEAMPTLKSTGNLNNTYGLPLCLLQLQREHRAAVLEMGMSYAGELTVLSGIADPDVGVLLNVHPVHREHFDSLEAIADAKGELFRGMRDAAVAVYNAEDPQAARVVLPFRGQTIGFGFGAGCEARATEVRTSEGGSAFTLTHGQTRIPVEIRFPGRHHVANALAAGVAALCAGASGEAVAKGLARVRPLPMRGAMLRFPGEVRVMDESYNSNPKAMEQTLETFADIPARRRIVASGDMLELGPEGVEAHRVLGRQVAGSGAALFVAVGPLSRLSAESARASGLKDAKHFETSPEAGQFLAGALSDGDLVLVKGSRGIAMERVVEAIRASRGQEES